MNGDNEIYHTEEIRCAVCGSEQEAIVEHTYPEWTYVHECIVCHNIITESEWDLVGPVDIKPSKAATVGPFGDSIPETIHAEVKYIHGPKGVVIALHRDSRGLWVADDGTVFALAENTFMVDKISRCGLGPVSLPNWFDWMRKLNRACSPHDFKYSSPAYQMFHTRSEADADLKRDIKTISKGAWWGNLAQAFKTIARKLGAPLWENKETR